MTTPKRKRSKVPDARRYLPVRASAVAECPNAITRVCVYRYALPARANRKLHWSQVKAQRQLGARMAALLEADLPCTIVLTRVSPGTLDGHDGIGMAFKAIVDGIADALVGTLRTITSRSGVVRYKVVGDDSDPRITWKYEQRKGPYAIEARYEVRT